MVIRTRINSAQSIFFWNITCRQVISPVIKFHNVLGRGFMIQRMNLILLKCLSASQKSIILHWKYNIYKYLIFVCLKRGIISDIFNSVLLNWLLKGIAACTLYVHKLQTKHNFRINTMNADYALLWMSIIRVDFICQHCWCPLFLYTSYYHANFEINNVFPFKQNNKHNCSMF